MVRLWGDKDLRKSAAEGFYVILMRVRRVVSRIGHCPRVYVKIFCLDSVSKEFLMGFE